MFETRGHQPTPEEMGSTIVPDDAESKITRSMREKTYISTSEIDSRVNSLQPGQSIQFDTPDGHYYVAITESGKPIAQKDGKNIPAFTVRSEKGMLVINGEPKSPITFIDGKELKRAA